MERFKDRKIMNLSLFLTHPKFYYISNIKYDCRLGNNQLCCKTLLKEVKMNIYIFSGITVKISGKYINILSRVIYALKKGKTAPFGLKGEFQVLKLVKQ